MASIEEQYAQRQADAQKTYDTRQAENTALYNQRQAAAQTQYNQRNAEAQNTYNQRLAESQGKINDIYGKALDAQKLQYKSALDKGIAAQEEARAGIAQAYQTSANDLSAQYERNKRNLNMQALAHGLNTGTGSQQQLALNQGYMGAYGKLRGEESAQNAGIDRAIANLKVDYENGIAQALANNDYQRAAALMDDYNNKQGWLDAQRMNNQNRFDTLSDNNQNRMDSLTINNQSRFDASSDNNRSWADSEKRYQDQMGLQKAETLASYGDFSGYASLYGQDVANNMSQMWAMQNPDLAYATGRIDGNKYFQLTGQIPMGFDFGFGGFGGGGGWGGGGSDTGTGGDATGDRPTGATRRADGSIITAGDVGWNDTKAMLGISSAPNTSSSSSGNKVTRIQQGSASIPVLKK